MTKKKNSSALTSSEKQFNNLIDGGISSYNHSADAKSIKNTIKHAENCIRTLNKGVNLAKIIGIENKLPYIFEYICLAQSLLANAHIENKDLKKAIDKLKEAKESNRKTLTNQQTFIRGAYIESKFMNIASLQENWRIADQYAQNVYKYAKKIDDPTKKLNYLTKIKDIFIKSKNLDFINNSYKLMIDLGKKPSDDMEFQTEISSIYFDYGNYLEVVLKKKKKAKLYFSKASAIFSKLSLEQSAKMAEERLHNLEK